MNKPSKPLDAGAKAIEREAELFPVSMLDGEAPRYARACILAFLEAAEGESDDFTTIRGNQLMGELKRLAGGHDA